MCSPWKSSLPLPLHLRQHCAQRRLDSDADSSQSAPLPSVRSGGSDIEGLCSRMPRPCTPVFKPMRRPDTSLACGLLTGSHRKQHGSWLARVAPLPPSALALVTGQRVALSSPADRCGETRG